MRHRCSARLPPLFAIRFRSGLISPSTETLGFDDWPLDPQTAQGKMRPNSRPFVRSGMRPLAPSSLDNPALLSLSRDAIRRATSLRLLPSPSRTHRSSLGVR